MRRNVIAACVVLLLCVAASPATGPSSQPTRVWRDWKSIVEAIPKDRRPAAGQEWTNYHRALVSEWLAAEIRGSRFDGAAEFSRAYRSNRKTYCAARSGRPFKALGFDFTPAHVSFEVPEKDALGMAKRKQGESMRIAGEIEHIDMHVSFGQITVRLKDVVIRR